MKRENTQTKTSEKNQMNAQEIAKAFEVIAKAMEAGFDFETFSALVSKTTSKKETDAVKKNSEKAIRTAFSKENVREIERMIKNGATTAEICARFGICATTIKNYLVKHHKLRPGHVKSYMDKLHDNNMKAKRHVSQVENAEIAEETYAEAVEKAVAEAESAEPVEEAVAESETANLAETAEPVEEAVAEPEPANLAETAEEIVSETSDVNVEADKCYMIDCNIIQHRKNREKWGKLVNKLRNERSMIYIYSKKYLERYMTEHWSYYARDLAASLLKDSAFTVVNTDLYIQWAAAMYEAKPILCNEKIAEHCKEAGIDYIMLDDYLSSTAEDEESETYVIDPDDAEAAKWVKKLTIPVSINGNKHAILKIADVADFAKRHYGRNMTVNVYDSNKNERKSPTGMLRIYKGDFVKFTGDVTVILKFSEEQLKNNCYEVYYAKTAVATAKTKTA